MRIRDRLDKDAKSTTLSRIEIDGKTLTKECDMLEALSCHFVSVGPKLARSIETRPNDNCLQHITQINEEMLFKPVDKKYVMNAINQLKNGNASGSDKITITLVKDASEYIAHPLMLIYNSSLANGAFPDVLKLARVTPIY